MPNGHTASNSNNSSSGTNLEDDTTPTLGGNLDCNNYDIQNANLVETNTLDIRAGLVDAIHPGNGNFQNIVQNTV